MLAAKTSPNTLAKVATCAVVAFIVAVVPALVWTPDHESAQRVVTESSPDDDTVDEATEDEATASADALPLFGADDEGPELLVMSSTTEPGAATTAGETAADGSDGDEEGDGESTSSSVTSSATVVSTTTMAPTTTSTAAAPPTTLNTAPGVGHQTLYVDGSRGSGSNPGTEDRPFRRPIEALSIAEPGTTIYLRGGIYDTSTHGAFNIRRSGTADRWIRIAPYPGERVELVAGGEYGSGFEVLGASYIEVSGFVIRGRNDSIHGSGVFVKDGASNVRVVANQISNFGGGGISIIGSSMVTIEGNEVRNNAFRSHYQGSAISLFKMSGPTTSGFSNVIRGNYVVGNYNGVPHADGRITDGNCIILDRNDEVGYRGRTLIENNVCAENGGRGIHSYRSSYIEARNNTLYHNVGTDAISAGRGEMTVGEATDVSFYNNLVINRPGIASYIDNKNTNSRFANNYVASGPPPGQGNQVLSGGLFSFSRSGSAAQFRPPGSAGLSGSAAGQPQASNDFTGRSRPSAGSVGAFEP